MTTIYSFQPHLNRQFLSRNSMQFLSCSRSELHQVSNMFKTLAISWRPNRRSFARTILKLKLRARKNCIKMRDKNRLFKTNYPSLQNTIWLLSEVDIPGSLLAYVCTSTPNGPRNEAIVSPTACKNGGPTGTSPGLASVAASAV